MAYLKFTTQRAAFIYFKLPPGNFSDYAADIESEISKIANKSKGTKLQLLYGTGGPDLIVRLDVPHFRVISDIQRELLAVKDLSCTWIFTVPYDWKSAEDASPLRYIMHLRLNRQIFLGHRIGTEHLLLEKLRYLLQQATSDSISGQIHACVNWSDLLISGSYENFPEKLLPLILKIRELRMENAQTWSEPVFAIDRTLVVLGIDSPKGRIDFDHPSLSGVKFKTFQRVRSSIGGFREALKVLARGQTPVFAHDGLFDLSTTSTERSIQSIVTFTHGDADAPQSGIERTETHLIFTDPKSASEEVETACQRGELTIEVPAPEHHHQRPWTPTSPKIPICLEVKKLRLQLNGFKLLVDKKTHLAKPRMPESLAVTISNVLSILSYSALDELNHFDSQPAISACLRGLETILKELSEAHRLYQASKISERRKWHREIENMHTLLREWCDSSQRILSERIAGSFEEIFGVSDRLSSFRGGLQKFLILADQILHGFFLRVRPPGHWPDCPRFATIHEPVDEIKSIPLLGIVKIPYKNRFSLARVVPDLWHEVGVHMFNITIPRGRSKFLLRQLSAHRNEMKVVFGHLDRLARGMVSSHVLSAKDGSELTQRVSKSPDYYKREQLKRLRDTYVHDRPGKKTPEQIHDELAEMYSDILVYFYGFRGRKYDFLNNLITTRLELLSLMNYPPKVLREEYSRLLSRIYLIHLFHKMDGFNTFSNMPPIESIGSTVQALCWLIREEVLPKPRFRAQWCGSDSYLSSTTERQAITDTTDLFSSKLFSMVYLPILTQLTKHIPSHAELTPFELPHHNVELLTDGVPVDIGFDAVNDYALELHLLDVQSFLEKTREKDDEQATPSENVPHDYLPHRAALARSALAAFHEAQVLGQLDATGLISIPDSGNLDN